MIGCFQIGGALADAIFQLFLNGSQLGFDALEILDIGGGADPLHDPAEFVAHRQGAGEMPAIVALAFLRRTSISNGSPLRKAWFHFSMYWGRSSGWTVVSQPRSLVCSKFRPEKPGGAD